MALVALFFALPAHLAARCCMPGGQVCALPQVRRRYRALFWLVVALVIAALGFPAGCAVVLLKGVAMKKLVAMAALAIAYPPSRAATQTVTLSVPGMTCAACPDHGQEEALSRSPALARS